MNDSLFIEVIEPKENTTLHYLTCRLHANDITVPVLIRKSDYDKLRDSGFFLGVLAELEPGIIDHTKTYHHPAE